jgi:hypothetical protein
MGRIASTSTICIAAPCFKKEKIRMNPVKSSQIEGIPKMYRTSKGWRIFFFIILPPFIGIITWLIVYSFTGNDLKDISTRLIIFLMGLGFDIFLIYGIFYLVKYRVELFPGRIVEIGVFKKKEIVLEKCEGFRVLPTQYINQVQFIRKGTGKKISMALMMHDSNGFLQWLNCSLRNLDAEEYEKEVKTILSNEALGVTEQQRVDAFERARKYASILNYISLAAMLWVLIKPQPYEIAIWTVILLPIIVLASSRLFSDIIRFDGPRKGVYPTIAGPFLMPGIALSLRAFLDWNILSWNNFWMPFAGISVTLSCLLLFSFKEVRKKYGQAIGMITFCAVYGYGATISLNGINDKSRPACYSAAVIDKRVSTGKTTSYYLKLSPWGPRNAEKEVDVSKDVYHSVGIIDSVSIFVKNGAMNIPWFFVMKNQHDKNKK